MPLASLAGGGSTAVRPAQSRRCCGSQQPRYHDALRQFRGALLLRPDDAQFALAERNCAKHIAKVESGGAARQEGEDEGEDAEDE